MFNKRAENILLVSINYACSYVKCQLIFINSETSKTVQDVRKIEGQ